MTPLLLLVLAGCTETIPAQIAIDLSPVNLGIRTTDAEPRSFTLQLSNRGEEILTIDSVTFEGDQYCSFEFEGPDETELALDQAAFVRGWWQPQAEDADQIVMVVASNSEEFGTLIVPICGLGVAPGTVEADPIECQAPPDSQPDCGSR